MKRRVTMQQIAEHLHISKNSVSQALSGKDGVSEETRKQIQKAADELGYIYTTKQKKPVSVTDRKTIGLIASDFAFSRKDFFSDIYLTIQQEADAQQVNLLIYSLSPSAIESLTMPAFIKENQVDGVLILSHLSTDYTNKVLATGIPAVLIDHHHPFIQADAILTNNRFGAYTAVQHLIDLHHTTIGFVGNTNLSPSYQERLEGYLLAFNENQIPVNPAFIFDKAVEEEEQIEKLVTELPEQPTAWFCVNDGLGYMVSTTLTKLGYHIPDDASICSFDNGQLSKLTIPKTTTVAIDLKRFGRKAVERLLWRIDHPEEPIIEMLLPSELIKRESTGKRK